MEIVSIFENDYCLVVENNQKHTSQWNGRTINSIADMDLSSRKIISVMQKMPGDAEIGGGYSEEKGVYVEGKIKFSWGESKPPESSSTPNNNESEPEQNANE